MRGERRKECRIKVIQYNKEIILTKIKKLKRQHRSRVRERLERRCTIIGAPRRMYKDLKEEKKVF